MTLRLLGLAAGLLSLVESSHAEPGMPQSTIYLAAPSVQDRYYRPKFDHLVSFYQTLIQAAHPRDQFVIVSDAATRSRLERDLPARHLANGPMQDIWIRDVAPIHTPRGRFKVRYRPNYLSQADARHIENGFLSWLSNQKLAFQEDDLILDGGNYVANGSGWAVVTRRVLRDNATLTEAEIRERFRTRFGITSLAIVPEEPGDTTGHSDGMVFWLSSRHLAVNEFSDPKFHREVRAVLKAAFPDAELVDLVCSSTNRRWRGFADATGIYCNVLTTSNAHYLPQFSLRSDPIALQTAQKFADRPVIPVPVSPEVAIMGGALRCLSWEASSPTSN